MNIKKWFSNLSFLSKMIWVYIIFGVIPMLGLTSYSYIQTKQILQEQSYLDIKQYIETTGKGIESVFKPYKTIMGMLYTNQMMTGYLSMDYTDLSYSEMFYYIDGSMKNIFVLNPNLKFIRFYSDNKTLPNDNYYFYQKEELDEEFIGVAERNRGKIMIGGIIENKEEPYITLVCKMNYYSSGGVTNYLALGISQEDLNQYLKQGDANKKVYLINYNGMILASSEKKQVRQNISDILEGWENISEQNVKSYNFENNSKIVSIRREQDMGMWLLVTIDQKSLFQEARMVSKKILIIFLLISLFAFLMILAYSRFMAKRVGKIVYATKRLGEGKFDYILKDMGQDEIGQISDAFNLMNEQIQILIKENYRKKILIKSSEMNLLQEQINPHFLYNALAVISSIAMREGGNKTVESVSNLANFYRKSLNKGRQAISVQEEVELLKSYMKIQMIRFSDMVNISYDIDTQVLSYRTIKLILQPLVENSINHGRSEDEVLHIQVRVGQKSDRVFYEVKDDGIGIEREKLLKLRSQLKESQGGFGLKNVDIRIKLNYGDDYGVKIQSVYEKGTCIYVEIPKISR